MILSSLTIQNFKGIREPVKINFKPVTLLFGPNSAGKSSVFHALHYAREIFERKNFNPGTTLLGGDTIDLGGFKNLVYKHDLSREIKLGLEVDFRPFILPTYTISEDEIEEEFDYMYADIPSAIHSAVVKIDIGWSSIFEKPIATKYEVAIDGVSVAKISASKDRRQIYLSYLDLAHPLFKKKNVFGKNSDDPDESVIEELAYSIKPDRINGNDFNLGIINQKSALPNWNWPIEFQDEIWTEKLFGGPEEDPSRKVFTEILSRILVGCGEMVRNALFQTCHLGPLRTVPHRNYVPAKSPDISRWASGIAAWDVIYKSDPGFLSSLNTWLIDEEKLNTDYTIEVKQFKELDVRSPVMVALSKGTIFDEDQFLLSDINELPTKTRLFIRDETSGVELMPQDIGVGISQVLPIIVAALHFKNGIVSFGCGSFATTHDNSLQ